MNQTDPDDQENRTAKELLAEARAAAAARQPGRMLECLSGSGFLDGLVRRLAADWGARLPRHELEDCVAIAVDSAYDAVAERRQVFDLGAWLWKAAWNSADDLWSNDYSKRVAVEGENLVVADEIKQSDEQRELADKLAVHRRTEAIRLARQLLPRIGEGQLVAVMEVVIDAVEQGVSDLRAPAIADTLGISPNAVRSLLSRGFQRLAREARREGIELPEDVPLGELDDDQEPVEAKIVRLARKE